MKTIFLSTMLLLAAWGSQHKIVPVYIENASATVTVNVCSRGWYQYLITFEDDTTRFVSQGLPQAFQGDSVRVILDGIFRGDSTDVLRPGANDVPIPVFKAPVLEISSASKGD